MDQVATQNVPQTTEKYLIKTKQTILSAHAIYVENRGRQKYP